MTEQLKEAMDILHKYKDKISAWYVARFVDGKLTGDAIFDKGAKYEIETFLKQNNYGKTI